MTGEGVRMERHDRVLAVLLSRPEKRNALTPGMIDALCGAIGEAAGQVASGDAGALVVGGDGAVFCGGFDLKMCLREPGTTAALLRGLHRAIGLLGAIEAPVVVAAQGAAIAGGCALVAAGDFAVGDRRGQYGYPVVRLGLSPAVSAPPLRGAVGDGPMRERMLDTALVDGDRALRLGLLWQACESADEVLPAAVRLAAMLAAKPAAAMTATKRLLRELQGAGDLVGPEAALGASLASADTVEMKTYLARALAPAKTGGPAARADDTKAGPTP